VALELQEKPPTLDMGVQHDEAMECLKPSLVHCRCESCSELNAVLYSVGSQAQISQRDIGLQTEVAGTNLERSLRRKLLGVLQCCQLLQPGEKLSTEAYTELMDHFSPASTSSSAQLSFS